MLSDEPLKVLGYARVSTQEQEDSGNGLDAQEQRIREACAQRGWELRGMVREGASGKDLRREALRAALYRVAIGESRGLVVAKLDRLSRSLVDFAMLLDWFRDNDATFVALDFDLDTSTPTGELMAQMLMVVAAWERRATGQRTKDALAVLRAQGRPINQGSVADRPELVERILALRNGERLTYRQICERLNGDGVPTVRGGGLWRPSALQAVLGGGRRPVRRGLPLLPQRPSRKALPLLPEVKR